MQFFLQVKVHRQPQSYLTTENTLPLSADRGKAYTHRPLASQQFYFLLANLEHMATTYFK